MQIIQKKNINKYVNINQCCKILRNFKNASKLKYIITTRAANV